MDGKFVLAKAIIENAHAFKWYMHGTGFIFLRLSDNQRLHIFHQTFVVKGTALIHDHFWNFRSTILAGSLTNTTYVISELGLRYALYELNECGIADKVLITPNVVSLTPDDVWCDVGDSYFLHHQVPHSTAANDGTVTLIQRRSATNKQIVRMWHPVGHAPVLWDERRATNREVTIAQEAALHAFA